MRDATRNVGFWKPTEGTRVFRAVRPSSDAGVTTGRAGADKYRTVWKSTANDYRWTGPRPPIPATLSADLNRIVVTRPPVGGINTALSLNDAALGEFTWYATENSELRTAFDEDVRRVASGKSPSLKANDFQSALSESRVFEYAVSAGITIADLSLSSNAGRALLDSLIHEIHSSSRDHGRLENQRLDALRSAIKAAGYVSPEAAYTSRDDYSFCRALHQSVRDLLPGCRGVRVTSVRSDAGTRFWESSGDNLILFGARWDRGR